VQSPQTPGVYYQRVDVSAPAISALRTDIAGFVGIATRGPLHQALPVQSFRQFQAYVAILPARVSCRMQCAASSRTAANAADCSSCLGTSAAAETTLQSETGQDIWKVSASSPGVWGNDLEIAVRETHQAQTLSVPTGSYPEFSEVASTTGFNRGVHVRLSQGANTVYKVVSDIDAVNSRLIWLHPSPEARLPYDSVLSGFDFDLPILIESIEYTLWVKELGTLTKVYQGLSVVPENPRYGPQVLAQLIVSQFSGEFLTLPASPEPLIIEERRTLPILDLAPIAISPNTLMPLSGATTEWLRCGSSISSARVWTQTTATL